MEIREAVKSDIPNILQVLKASLGESSSKKTEQVWRYKHIDNPFGTSLVLIALENSQVIGVRAFMRWNWQQGEKVYSAFRAVDTATHPSHQGKGIFKKLTLRALEIGKERGYNFVFNTPNTQSKPGYIKMGWCEVDKLKIHLRPLIFFNLGKKNNECSVCGKSKDTEKVLELFFEKQKMSKQFFTPKNSDFLFWRYINNPLQNYSVIFDKDFFIAGYLKRRKRFNEFRITEVIILDKGKERAKSKILEMANTSGASILSISPNNPINFKTGLTKSFGPTLTMKDISLNQEEIQILLDLSKWSYSLGDLELF
ncbi:GNAT family N-acetyltransferase [Salegentibacter mishustinae]|uniref:GNAT family N-acetyltransferase n=1 Tax=Salegentibacter mishustinae TaxID=270918 RepID=UPI002490FAFE|nr:GNAT family N-acetyltransferase [Salegentibacter mishustinae]